MMSISKEAVEAAIKTYIEPHLNSDLVSAACVKKIEVSDQKVSVQVTLGFPADSIHDALRSALTDAIVAAGAEQVEVAINTKITAHAVQQGVKRLSNVKNIIAVASGKGGVGKSTTSVNLALALSAEGARVGILDADIYGPSQPRMMGVSGQPQAIDDKSMHAMSNYGVEVMSIGFMIDDEQPVIWRGPMVVSALDQLLNQTAWSDLDYLIIDLPPGTGDIQLSLSQKVPLTGAVIVTTPQDIALLDARKGLKMFEKVKVPILGIVENMSTHVCSKCGHEEAIFGTGGGEKMVADYNTRLLGSLPLTMDIRQQADGGRPTVVSDPEGHAAQAYRSIARNAAAEIAQLGKDYSARFPKIVIQNT